MDLSAMYFKPDNKAFDLKNLDDDKTIQDVTNPYKSTDKDDDLSVKSLAYNPISALPKPNVSSDS